MKKFSYVSLMLALVISFILIPKTTNASMPDVNNLESTELNYSDEQIQPYDYLTSELVKKKSKSYCLGDLRSINQEEVIIDTTNVSDIDVLSGAPFTSQIRTSSSGSRIVSPTIPGSNLGYCHIFEGHMQFANGFNVENHPAGTQFAEAHFPLQTMDIVMEVVNGTDNLKPVPGNSNRKSKTAYSKTAGSRVIVFLQKGASMSSYQAYDWVVITAYPV